MNVYPIRAVRTPDWKYIRNLHPEFQYHTHMSRSAGPHRPVFWDSWLTAAKTNPAAAAVINRSIQHPAEELYDLANDPDQVHNLADKSQHADTKAKLSSQVDAWMHQTSDPRLDPAYDVWDSYPYLGGRAKAAKQK